MRGPVPRPEQKDPGVGRRCRRLGRMTVLPLALAFMLGAPLGWSSPPSRSNPVSASDEKITRAGLPHLGTSLGRLLLQWTAEGQKALRDASNRGLEIEDGRVRVTIVLLEDGDATRAAGEIVALGGTITARAGRTLEAWVPIAKLDRLQDLDGISIAHRTLPPVSRPAPPTASKRSGPVESQGVVAANADAWHAAGIAGQDASVAIIDRFDGWQQAQSEGELPSSLLSVVGELDLSEPQGTAVAEVIHDMAPAAELVLASASGYVEFAQAIVDLAAAGHDVIVSSMAPVEPGPGDGSGVLADAIADARQLHDAVYIQAAGDWALQHWEGNYSDTDGDDVHEFAGGEYNRLGAPGFELVAGQRVTILLSWDDWPVSDQDFDLYLYRQSGSTWDLVDASENYQTGTEPPWELIDYTVPLAGTYALTIERWDASTASFFDLRVHAPEVPLEFQVTDRSLSDIAAAPAAVSVGAADVSSTSLETTSSRGPAYGPGGVALGGHDQPRMSGFDNVDTWSFGIGGFAGTAAGCAHVAGAAALIRDAYPEYGSAEVQSYLEGAAVDEGDPGYDYGFGFGWLWLGEPPAGCLYTLEPMSTDFGADGGDGSFTVSTTEGCDWTAVTADGWITVTAGATGSGPGSVSFHVDANPDPDGRTGTITVATRTFTVVQSGTSGCSYAISPPSASYPAAGGSGTVSVTTSNGCEWTSVSGDSWIVITSGNTGSGSGTATYEVQANPAGERAGSITIANHVHTVVQEGAAGCSYSISPTAQYFSAGGGNGTVEVDTDEGCEWSAESNDPSWLTVTDFGLGVGPGQVEYRVEANAGETRFGTMTIAGHEFTVEQAGRVGDPFTYRVAGVAHLSGVGGSEWRTSLCVTNASPATATLTMTYNAGAASVIRTFRMERFSSHEWEDVAVDLFGRTQPSSGSIEIISWEPILVTARTYNISEAGTFGQFMPGLDDSFSLSEGETGFLPQIRRSPAFRTNIGFQNRTALPTTVEVRLFAADGTELGNLVEITVPPVGWVQVNDVFTAAGAGACDLGCAVLTVTTQGGQVWAYASVVDNRTGDPTTIPLMVP